MRAPLWAAANPPSLWRIATPLWAAIHRAPMRAAEPQLSARRRVLWCSNWGAIGPLTRRQCDARAVTLGGAREEVLTDWRGSRLSHRTSVTGAREDGRGSVTVFFLSVRPHDTVLSGGPGNYRVTRDRLAARGRADAGVSASVPVTRWERDRSSRPRRARGPLGGRRRGRRALRR